MFDKDNLNELIISIDSELRSQANKFAEEKVDFDVLTHNLSYLANERTVAAYCNYYLNKYFINCGYPPDLAVNEFAIKIVNTISKPDIEKIKEESGCNIAKTWDYCFVDGYFKIKNILDKEPSHIFIEYKMEHCFAPLNLANDYLKYKTYTYGGNENTIFAYVIFDKKEKYPSILDSSNTRKDKFQLLSKHNDKKSLFKDVKVFLYQQKRRNKFL